MTDDNSLQMSIAFPSSDVLNDEERCAFSPIAQTDVRRSVAWKASWCTKVRIQSEFTLLIASSRVGRYWEAGSNVFSDHPNRGGESVSSGIRGEKTV